MTMGGVTNTDRRATATVVQCKVGKSVICALQIITYTVYQIFVEIGQSL